MTQTMAGLQMPSVVPFRLSAASPPFFDESPASWILNICSTHQYSYLRLSQILGLKKRHQDWDKGISDATWSTLLKATGASQSACLISRDVYKSDLVRLRVTRSTTRLSENEREPIYHWCAQCLDEDTRPYLRWYWRMRGEEQCRIHGSRLAKQCEHCGGVLSPKWELMGSCTGRNRNCVPDLRYCQHCGLPRGGHGPRVIKALGASLFVRKHPLTGPLFQSFGRQLRLRDISRITTGNLTRGLGPAPLQIDRLTFQRPERPIPTVLEREKWSSLIDRRESFSRSRLGYALRLVRKEMKVESLELARTAYLNLAWALRMLADVRAASLPAREELLHVPVHAAAEWPWDLLVLSGVP
ncbi:MAG: TniQ family protein [Pseudomonadota bacterium]